MSASESSSAVASSDGPDASADTGTQPGKGLFLRPAPIAIEQGYVLASRYEVERPLGRGATGVVLQAYDRVIRSPIAVKILNPELAADPKWIERLEAELRHGRRIVDPHVCRVFDIGQADGHHFLTMELASGGSLRQRLRMEGRAQPMREAEAREVVAGLAAIHAAGMVHRDVKPENVLCRENGQLMVSDFGLAVTPGQTTYHSGAAGTPSYMAPEVMLAEKATFASDVWSLGVVLHEIWFGKRPEWTTTARGRFLKLPIDGTSQAVDRAMANLCASCLEELPPRRHQDALIVQRELARALTGRSTRRRYGSTPLRWWWAAGALVVMSAAGLVGLSQRPAPLRPLQVTGTPADWLAGSRLLARFDSVSCLIPARRPDAVWVITRGSSGGAHEIDLLTGKSTPAPWPPETYASGCPQPQPGGRGLAYSATDPTTKLRQLVLLPTGVPEDGKQTMALSGVPLRWLSPDDLLYSLDARRTAVLSGGRPNLLPDPPGAGTLMSSALNRHGTELALLFGDRADSSLVQRLRFPTLEKLDVVNVAGSVFSADYDHKTGGLLMTVGAPYWKSVAELSTDGRSLRARGMIERAHIERLLAMPAGLVFTTTRVNTKVLLRRPDGTTVSVAPGSLLSNPTVSARGDVLLLERLSDGRGVVVFQRHTDTQPTRLTEGPQDAAPTLDADGRGFVYVRADRNEIVRCLLEGPDAPACEVVARGEQQQLQTASVSGNGRFVVYVAATRTGPRLSALDRTTQNQVELGPSVSSCRVRWSGPNSFWYYRGDKRVWTETTLPQAHPTGRIVSAPDNPCATELPGTPRLPFSVSLEQTGGTELRLVQF